MHSPMLCSQAPTSEQIIQRVLTTGKITAADRNWFLKATLSESPLSAQEMKQVQQLFDRLRMGLLKVVD